jgi:hypothetical protein
MILIIKNDYLPKQHYSIDFLQHRRAVHGTQKVTQPILKYLLMVAFQYNSIGLRNTQYRCGYTRAHAGHVML